MPPKLIPYSALRNTVNCLELPRLPFPPLQDTFRRYAASLAPLRPANEVSRHLEKMKKFATTTAPIENKKIMDLDAALAKRGGWPNSYIEEAWDAGYLEYRAPLPFNTSPALALCPAPSIPGGQCGFAAACITSTLRLIRKMLDNQLDAYNPPTDMASMNNMFCFARVPYPGRDYKAWIPLNEAKHIAVMCRGYIFFVNVYDENGSPYSTETLTKAFEGIKQSVAGKPLNSQSLGYLTTMDRDEWARAHGELMLLSPNNENILREMQKAIVVVCLDSNAYDDSNRDAWHCIGTGEGGNRWFDKHQLLVDTSARGAGCFEHSFSDGILYARWFGEMMSDMLNIPSGYTPLPKVPFSSKTPGLDEIVRPVVPDLNDSLTQQIEKARLDWGKTEKESQFATSFFPYGSKKIKTLGIGPDAYVQAAMHLAYYRTHEQMAPAYESCSTGAFWRGRTETIRSATTPMLEFVKSVKDRSALDSSEARQTAKAKLKAAGDAQRVLAKEASMGLGVDRHLLALKNCTMRTKDPAGMDFFNDELFGYSGTWVLSSSNVSREILTLFHFGAVAPNGYGIAYIICKDLITLGLSCFRSNPKTSLPDFQKNFESAGEDLQRVLGAK